MVKVLGLLLILSACAFSQLPTYSITVDPNTPPFNQNASSPTLGPFDAGGNMDGTCRKVSGPLKNRITTVYTINTYQSGVSVNIIEIGVILPSGGRGPCHVPVAFTAHGSQVWLIDQVGTQYIQVPGLEAGVFSMTWFYQGTSYSLMDYADTYCDGTVVDVDSPGTSDPC